MRKKLTLLLVCLALLSTNEMLSQKRNARRSPSSTDISPSVFSGLRLRNLTPGKTGGRVVDVAFHPTNRNIRFVAVASGGVWKTVNAGTTWTPVFDNEGSFSIGTVIVDPRNPNTVWVGSGENNAQRSVSMGDGVYKSVDGGLSWTNMGLKTSEHIGKIVIHPENSDIVYVAAQGGLWKAGGDRGLYKTTNGGKSWERVLHISEDTGISDVIIDPRDPDVLIASSYQRRRHFGILVGGGPDGGAFKSTDGGENWTKLKGGFPQGELGRIGLARSPQQPDVVYALVAGTDQTKGFYRSSNNGDNWTKMNDYMVIDAQYYMEIFPDPHQFDKLYVVDVVTQVSEDGGRTFKRISQRNLHSDNHEIEFDPNDPNYLMIAGDGGVFESWDKGTSWRFTDNLPITQFYRVGIDNEKPFYNVYGGTQDNNTIGGPSQTTKRHGISNADWNYTLGGDGFQTRVDPTNPDILYSMYQYAGIVRYDRKSGETIDIQPQPEAGEPPFQWNWDAPLVISAYDHKTLYFAADRLFKSEDQGNSWKDISGNLTRQLNRNQMEVMGRVWGIDAVFKNVWTSPYGTIVSLSESPIKKGLIYAGTDDGLIQVTENDGQSWRRIEGISGVPKLAYLADVFASSHNENTVFAVFNNHKYGDYKPYFFRSDDKGLSWKNISSSLPATDFGWTILQDHVKEDLLFAGTEYGLYFSLNGGDHWFKFHSGIPTIAIRDLEVHQGEDDLIAASFGRGFYILDDYSALRAVSSEALEDEAILFPVKDAWSFVKGNPDGYAFGANFYRSANPTFGAVFTYYLKESPRTLAQQRRIEEADKVRNNEPVTYPEWDDLTKEQREKRPALLFTIKNDEGQVVSRISTAARRGINRVAWNLRHSAYESSDGPLVAPGKYTVYMSQLVDGQWKDLEEEQTFSVVPLPNTTLPAADRKQLEVFQLEATKLEMEISKANRVLSAYITEIEDVYDQAIGSIENAQALENVESVRQKLLDLRIKLNGNPLISQNMELPAPSIRARVSKVTGAFWSSTSATTGTHQRNYQIASDEFANWVRNFNELNTQIRQLEGVLEGIKITAGKQTLFWK